MSGRLDALLAQAQNVVAQVDSFFAANNGRGPNTGALQAAASYKDKLQSEYGAWAAALAQLLATMPPGDWGAVIADAMPDLKKRLHDLARQNLPDAMDLGLGDVPHDGESLRDLADALDENDYYLDTSLLPDVQDKLLAGLDPRAFAAAAAVGMGAAYFVNLLNSNTARVGLYANIYWELYNRAQGGAADEKKMPVYWQLDHSIPVDRHCSDCLAFGDKWYDSMDDLLAQTGGKVPGDADLEDAGNCRCELIYGDPTQDN